jgi:hypothetical protein
LLFFSLLFGQKSDAADPTFSENEKRVKSNSIKTTNSLVDPTTQIPSKFDRLSGVISRIETLYCSGVKFDTGYDSSDSFVNDDGLLSVCFYYFYSSNRSMKVMKKRRKTITLVK